MSTSRRYYSTRTGKNPAGTRLELPLVLRLFRDVYDHYYDYGYFQEAFGYECVDDGHVPGTLGLNVGAQFLRRLRKTGLWPIIQKYSKYTEDDLFDVIEFLYDHVSRPIDGYLHDYNDCGWHYRTFDQATGREEYRSEINQLLHDYIDGYELSAAGEILALPDKGVETLLQAPLPNYDPQNVETRVENAILKFRRHRSSAEDRRDAIRDLADVLEFLRPKLKKVIMKSDESDLFNIANNFGIRHHNDEQKTEYDRGIWYSWLFYYYLSTIHAGLRLIKKHEQSGGDKT